MADVAKLYNTLPTLQEADDSFVDRGKLFAALKTLLSEFGFAFGLCLVHAHCELEDDEIMLSRGRVSEPERVSEASQSCFPERWLASGEPYEFTTRPTTAPPAALLDGFRRLTSDVKVLGLYHIDRVQQKADKMLECTQGRKNVLMEFTDADQANAASHIATAWDLSSFDPVTVSCSVIIYCIRTLTDDGTDLVHTGESDIQG